MDELIERGEERGTSSQMNSMQNTVDYEAEYVMLPSQGMFYKGKYKGLDKLKVRKLDWSDEDILTTKSYYDNGTLFDELLKQTVVDENGFDTEDLIPIDRDTIIWWLRMGAFGTEYQIPYTCKQDNCGNKFKISWDLSDFETPDISETYRKEIEETGGIMIELPASKLKCKITLASIGTENKVNKFLKKRKDNIVKSASGKKNVNISKDYIVTGKLLSSIEICFDHEGKEYKGIDNILTWLNTGFGGKKIPMIDSRYIVEKIKDINLTVETKKDIECPVCKHIEEDVNMPMTIYFFWPEFK